MKFFDSNKKNVKQIESCKQSKPLQGPVSVHTILTVGQLTVASKLELSVGFQKTFLIALR